MLARTSTCCPCCGRERHPAVAVTEHHFVHLSGIVFERKVPVARRRLREINLAADPYLSISCSAADRTVWLGGLR